MKGTIKTSPKPRTQRERIVLFAAMCERYNDTSHLNLLKRYLIKKVIEHLNLLKGT